MNKNVLRTIGAVFMFTQYRSFNIDSETAFVLILAVFICVLIAGDKKRG